jgi:hypothetical protein
MNPTSKMRSYRVSTNQTDKKTDFVAEFGHECTKA